MFKVRTPAIICLTTSPLLNATDSGGIFNGLLSKFTTIIGNEASQIPEPAMVAIATRVPDACHVYTGDVHQLESHIRCSRTSTPAKFGALGVMDLLVQRRIPMAPLTTTFRPHPELNAMPNRLFNNNTLISGTTAANRRLFLNNTRCRNRKLPFLFVKVTGYSQRTAGPTPALRRPKHAATPFAFCSVPRSGQNR
ncbi:unnamed protein product [Heligmosomoides polygyrus]|uniref:Secreted protein n=1 Tax=Heligmosomoides polygyrus TaxID=6339 RepID=A0A183GXG1_HELPZ|nr:unnamed protein product [Heligmosomoides polygyrus]